MDELDCLCRPFLVFLFYTIGALGIPAEPRSRQPNSQQEYCAPAPFWRRSHERESEFYLGQPLSLEIVACVLSTCMRHPQTVGRGRVAALVP